MAFKRERIENIIKKEISSMLLSEVKDERLKYVTITNVNLTNDLSIATVYYTVLGEKDQIAETSDSLLEAKGFIKGLLSKRLDIRKIPDLRFKYDESFEHGNRIEEILKNLKG